VKIKIRVTDRIRPCEQNLRLNDPAVDAPPRSLQDGAFPHLIVIDKVGMDVAGNSRWKA
jgi:hypothetical protein